MTGLLAYYSRLRIAHPAPFWQWLSESLVEIGAVGWAKPCNACIRYAGPRPPQGRPCTWSYWNRWASMAAISPPHGAACAQPLLFGV